MMYSISRIMMCMVTLSPFFFGNIDAYCSRCVKIEEERAKEQANNPQPVAYYDDQAKLKENENSASDQQLNKAANKTE